MTNRQIISLDEAYIMPTYAHIRRPAAMVRGQGSTLFDADGRGYIDFGSGIGVNCLGYSDPGWVAAVTAQLTQISHISNYYPSPVSARLAEELCRGSGMGGVFFANSGAEANEGAIKLARKYSSDKYGADRSTVVTLKNSFHGRTITTLAATGQDAFHEHFAPFTEGFKYIPLNDCNTLRDALTDDVCAVMIELIQGEGGINAANDGYINELRKLCAERDILVIYDEIQTGIGRTGKPYAFQHYGAEPDIMTLAKGLGGGLPIGVVLCREELKGVLNKGHHGSTYGANPVACAGALEVLNRIGKEQGELLKGVTKRGEYIRDRLKSAALSNVSEVRGMGLMIGIAVKGDHKIYAAEAFERGLLVLTAGTDVVRLLPPLNISEHELESGMNILIEALKQ